MGGVCQWGRLWSKSARNGTARDLDAIFNNSCFHSSPLTALPRVNTKPDHRFPDCCTRQNTNVHKSSPSRSYHLCSSLSLPPAVLAVSHRSPGVSWYCTTTATIGDWSYCRGV